MTAANSEQKAPLRTQIRRELQPNRLLPGVTAGLIIGISVAILAISLASLVFAGDLAPFAGSGMRLALLGAAIIAAIVTLTSSFAGTVADPQEAPAAILALMAAAIAQTMPAGAPPAAVFITVLAAMAVTGVLSGLAFLALGQFNLGELVRFLPYPVVGGFLAGTGWLLVTGAFTVMTDTAAAPAALLQPDLALRWLPGLLLAITMMILVNRIKHFLVMPALIFGAIGLFYLVSALTGTTAAQLSSQGWLLTPPAAGAAAAISLNDLALIDWRVIGNQIGNIATLIIISVIAILLNASGLELVAGRDIDVNRELRAAGLGNILTGLSGGLVGFHSLSLSSLSHKIAASSRLTGLVVAAFCAVILVWSGAVLALFPKIILGAMLMMLGLSFLYEWLYEAWFNFSRLDYLIIVTILVVIVTIGFLPGVTVGVILAVLLFVVNYSQIDVVKHSLSGNYYRSQVTRCHYHRSILRRDGGAIYILQLQGYIFFGTANRLFNQLRRRLEMSAAPRPRYVIVDFRQVTGLDSTAMLSFAKMKQLTQTAGIDLILTNAAARAAPRSGTTVSRLLADLGAAPPGSNQSGVHIFADLDRGLEWCEDEILRAAGADPAGDGSSLRAELSALLPDLTHLEQLLAHFERLEVDAGTYLMRQHDQPDHLFFIESGQVTAQIEYDDRPATRLESMRGGHIVGEVGFFLDQPRSATVVADVPTTILRLSRQALRTMEQNAPEAAFAFHQGIIRLISERLGHLTRTVAALQQ